MIEELAELKEVPNPCPGTTPEDIERCALFMTDPKFHLHAIPYLKYMRRKRELEGTIAYLQRSYSRKKNLMNVEGQADWEKEATGQHVITEENIIDHAGMAEDQRNFGTASVKPLLPKENLDPDNFFKRPINVYSGVFGQDADIFATILPMSLYLRDPSVRAKLRNYAFLRADVHVRIHISGTPFNMGRVQVSAIPWYETNPFYVKILSALPGTHNLMIQYLSTTKDVRYMDVADNKPLELVLPYISPKPVGRLFNADSVVITSTTPFSDLDPMYALNVGTISQVTSVSTDPTEVSMQIFVWLDNVILSTSTSTKLDVETQSEFETGPIEKMTTSALAVSKQFESVPVIAPYAKAASGALNVAKNVSHLYGFSRPTLSGDPQRMKNEPFQNGASTIGGEVGHRLTLDPKCELSLESGLADNAEDELVFSSFCKTYGLLTQFTWSVDSSPLSSIFVNNVNPLGHANHVVDGQYITQLTPMGYVARFFGYWRGSITYKFDIVASKYHRGRIAVAYEPNCFQRDLVLGGIQLNQPRVIVIDLQETRSFEITVNWAYHRPWAPCPSLAQADFAGINDNAYSNGFIYIYPLTKLQAPIAKNVQINVFVKSDDMRFNFLNNRDITQELKWEPQCDVEWSEDINAKVPPSKDLATRSFGEVPVSYRQIMKRYFTPYVGEVINTGDNFMYYSGPIQPPLTAAVDTENAPGQNQVMFRWIKYCFLGFRGGWKYRFFYSGTGNTSGVKIRVENSGLAEFDSSYTNTAISSSVGSINGSTVFMPGTNEGIEVEFPFYTNNDFVWSMDPNYAPNIDPVIDPVMLRNWHVTVLTSTNGANHTHRLDMDCAPADDFNFIRYVAIPPFPAG